MCVVPFDWSHGGGDACIGFSLLPHAALAVGFHVLKIDPGASQHGIPFLPAHAPQASLREALATATFNSKNRPDWHGLKAQLTPVPVGFSM